MRVQARVQDYALAITDASFVTVRDLRLFATTVYAGGESNAEDISNIRLDSLQLVHPSAGKRVVAWPEALTQLPLQWPWQAEPPRPLPAARAACSLE